MKRSTPERMYLLAEWGSKLPYRRAAELLNEMLPGLNRKISHTAIRRHALAVGALLDERIIEPDEYASLVPPRLPVPASNRLTIAIDSGGSGSSDRFSSSISGKICGWFELCEAFCLNS
jgi:hypothetical protein